MRASRGQLRVLGLTLALSSSAAFSLTRPMWLASSSPLFSGPSPHGPPPPFAPHGSPDNRGGHHHHHRAHPPPFHHDAMGPPSSHSRRVTPQQHMHMDGPMPPGPWERPAGPFDHDDMRGEEEDVGFGRGMGHGARGPLRPMVERERSSGSRVVVVGMRRPLGYQALRGGHRQQPQQPQGHTEDQAFGGVMWSPWSSVLSSLLLSPPSSPFPLHESQRLHRLSTCPSDSLLDGPISGPMGLSGRDVGCGGGGVKGWIVAFLPRNTQHTLPFPHPQREAGEKEEGQSEGPQGSGEARGDAGDMMPPPPPPPFGDQGQHQDPFPPPPPPSDMGGQGKGKRPPPPFGMKGQGQGQGQGPPPHGMMQGYGYGPMGPNSQGHNTQQQQPQQQGHGPEGEGQGPPPQGLPIVAMLVLGAVLLGVGVAYRRRQRRRRAEEEQAHTARLSIQHTSSLSAPLLVQQQQVQQQPSAPLRSVTPSPSATHTPVGHSMAMGPSLLQLPDGAYALLE